MRQYAIRKGVRVVFRVEPAGDCLVDEHGLVKVPALKAVPSFNVESLLSSVDQFALETPGDPPRRQKLSRAEIEALLGPAAPGQAATEE